MASRTQAHIFHLQTPSFAAHTALQLYYEGIVPLVDGFVESYQGKNGIITGYGNIALQEYETVCLLKIRLFPFSANKNELSSASKKVANSIYYKYFPK